MTKWQDYSFVAEVSDLKAEYANCGSHRLLVTLTVPDSDDAISLISMLIRQFVLEDFRENVKDLLEQHWPLGDQLENAAEKRMTDLVDNDSEAFE